MYDIVEYKILTHGFFTDEIWFSITRKVVVPPTDVHSGTVFITPSVIGLVRPVSVRNIDKCNGLSFHFLHLFNITFEINTHKREGSGRAVAPLNIHTPSDVRSFKPVQKLPPDFLCNITWVVTNACQEIKKRKNIKVWKNNWNLNLIKGKTFLPYTITCKTITIVLLSF